jgi:cytochrome c oxidase cbb3-type subunit 3
LKRVISAGRAGTLMPAFAAGNGGPLTAEQVSIVVAGIKSHWGAAQPAPGGTPPYRLESAKVARKSAHDVGLKVFSRACASCHGDNGQGSEMAGALSSSEFVSLLSDQALRRLIITGRPDLGMPNSSDGNGRPEGFKPLTSQEVTELVSLLASWRDSTATAVTANGN